MDCLRDLLRFEPLNVIKLAREPAVCLFMLLRPKGLKACPEAEKYAEFKNQSLRKIRRYTTWQYANKYPRHDPLLK